MASKSVATPHELTDAEKVSNIALLLFGIEAVVGECEQYANGSQGEPNQRLHGLLLAAGSLVNRGLKTAGAY